MINIISLIESLYSKKYNDFFMIINRHLFYDITDIKIINIFEDIKWYYMFNDNENFKIHGIILIKLIHNYYK